MSIKRFFATKDNTITNAFKENLVYSGSLANMGASDILEIFSIYGQATTSSLEKSRILIDFPVSDIATARTSGDIPASGSVKFKLKLFNARHSDTTPSNFTVSINPITSDWSEGIGLDMENYSDLDASNWESSSYGTSWTTPGGDYSTGSLSTAKTFTAGPEDLDVDITEVVESWIRNDISRYGFLIKMSGSSEDGSLKRSFYTKKFFARGTQFFFKRPCIEAQYDLSILDDRSSVFKSSSLAPASENLNNIYLYNRIRGQLHDIPATGSELVVQLFTSSATNGTPSTLPILGGVNSHSPTFITASKHSKGVYRAQFAYDGSETKLYDVWYRSDAGSLLTLTTGSQITIHSDNQESVYDQSQYTVNITNLKKYYKTTENANFRVYTRNKSWDPNLYTVASKKAPVSKIKEGYYQISRVVDNFQIVSFSTGSLENKYSKLSYDSSGSFFNLDMSILEPNYLYEISFAYKDNTVFKEIEDKFRFRVH